MAGKKKEEQKVGRLSPNDIRDLINKKLGHQAAFSLEEDNPSEVTEWISTGSRILDASICKGKLAGIPISKISELSGDSSSGKSYMAAQIAANAQKMGIDVIYFDSESALDPEFLSKAGCDLSKLTYVQAESVEFVLETIETLLGSNENKMLFIWDSLALTPSKTDIEGDFDPLSSMAVKPRILSKGLSKLIQPIANANATLLILNQLKTNLNVQNPKYATDSEKYTTPGGKSLAYAYSIRLWLTARRATDSFILNDKGYRIGNEVKVRLEKSRFGTQGRQCAFKIIWGGDKIGVCDEESWLEPLKKSPYIKANGPWYTLYYADGKEEKFQEKHWLNKINKQPNFKERILQLIDEEIIMKFKNQTGDASSYYNIDGEEELDNINKELELGE